jgi:hypothetical protein
MDINIEQQQISAELSSLVIYMQAGKLKSLDQSRGKVDKKRAHNFTKK